ncbi:sugar O-acyltransferase (sialic acid O-acetyltransferase NeuD family) [Flavobacterium sp. W4I14]|nr:sugar O-acyltransferase (sialic acid O-acetyltransferase NeuD family) [Flavobacterium sp. W4I14]
MADRIIYGTGGHARVLAAGLNLNAPPILGYFDDRITQPFIHGLPVMQYNPYSFPNAEVIIGIGNNEIRRAIAARVQHSVGTFIHPQAIVAPDVIIGSGSVILAGAVIQTGAILGAHVIVNANVTIDHDAVLDDFSSIYPNAYIGGGAKIGSGVTVAACMAVGRLANFPSVFEEVWSIPMDFSSTS